MKVLITAGPTQEPIDDVRYITNASSGKMGNALALEAIARGHDVTLVHGPVTLQLPECKKVAVRTTSDMLKAVLKELKGHDAFISTAAVSDYSPKKSKGKIKSGQKVTLQLDQTPKIIDEVRKKFPELFIVGFKAEYGLRRDELKVKSKDFLKRKGLNLLVANDIEKDAFGSEETDIIIAVGEALKEFGKKPKRELACDIWDNIELHYRKVC